MESLTNRIRRNIHKRIFIDYNRNYKNAIFLAGTGRSGTTWVSDILNYKNDYRYIFEPFYPQKVGICRNFKYRQYLRADNKDRDFVEPARDILSGRLRNRWTDKFNTCFISDKRLIKDIRANLLLKWLHENFPGIPIVLLLRHPCAVAASKIKINWGTHLEEFLSQDELMEDFLNPFRKEIERAESMFEKHIFLWCIENYIPLKQFKQGGIHLVFYENICLSPEQEVHRLFSFLGKKFDGQALRRLTTPSIPSRKWSAIYSGENLIETWKKHVTAEQMKAASEILSLFGLDGIYSQDSMPNMDHAYSMMRENR